MVNGIIEIFSWSLSATFTNTRRNVGLTYRKFCARVRNRLKKNPRNTSVFCLWATVLIFALLVFLVGSAHQKIFVQCLLRSSTKTHEWTFS